MQYLSDDTDKEENDRKKVLPDVILVEDSGDEVETLKKRRRSMSEVLEHRKFMKSDRRVVVDMSRTEKRPREELDRRREVERKRDEKPRNRDDAKKDDRSSRKPSEKSKEDSKKDDSVRKKLEDERRRDSNKKEDLRKKELERRFAFFNYHFYINLKIF